MLHYTIIPRAPSYLNSRLLGYVTIGYAEPSSHHLGDWGPRATGCLYYGSNRSSGCGEYLVAIYSSHPSGEFRVLARRGSGWGLALGTSRGFRGLGFRGSGFRV